MLTGEVPFRSPHPLAAMNERLLNNPEPPSELNSEIPAPLQDVILCALEREPENRYAGAREFAKQLENPSPYADKQFPITRTGALEVWAARENAIALFSGVDNSCSHLRSTAIRGTATLEGGPSR